MQKHVLVSALALALVGCSSQEAAAPAPATTAAATTVATATADPAALRKAAEELDRAATRRDTATAYGFYSQRCKSKIGTEETYGHMLDVFYDHRTPNYTDWVVKVNGSSGQVVTVDSDPSAPASAMDPRTWTFIDGRWQFDNC
ncbi:hypothetical protein ACFROC_05640 [Nocardia tengchongensis]|uniref:hypothetical protein n=1 Tax=Nocardia tengchongensis TaxID=2055889 RepID=UPI0036A0A71E